MADWMARADWALRTVEFGDLEEYARGVQERLIAMTLRAPGIDDTALNERLWDLWLAMPHHRFVFEPLRTTAPGDLLVRYAAIDWAVRGISIADGAVRIATLGIELTRVFDFVSVCIAEDDLGWFACPFVKIDLDGAPRVGFLNPAGGVQLMNRVAPEVLAQWPHCEAPGLVYAVGQLLLGLVNATSRVFATPFVKTPFGHVLVRCLDADPKRRFQTLAELRDALAIVGGKRDRTYHGREWTHVETAIGYALLGQPTPAAREFELALLRAPGLPLALAGRELMVARGAKLSEQPQPTLRGFRRWTVFRPTPQITQTRPSERRREWKEIRPVASALVEAGRFADALALYLSTMVTPENQVEIHIATARCHFGAREYGTAVDYAQRVLELEPSNTTAHEVRTESRYKRAEHDDALSACAEWISAASADGRPHYMRAKILLALGRLTEARDECERATELSPKHLPAMLLRWQLDRSIRRVRSAAGKAMPAPIDLPEHLRDLRELLVSGRTADAIAALERPEHATDTQAQLLRADLLLFSDQLDAALAVFEKTGGLAGKLGQATVLVRMGRPEDALALCDALVREHPNASEPHEGRAAALQALGRNAEADDAYKRALAANAQRSDVRVRLGRG